jgi:membrane protein involved in colicin uptake
MSRKQLENFLEQEKRTNLGGSITRFVIEPDASDEEKGQAKREKHIAKMQARARRQAKKQTVQRKAKAKRKAIDEQEMMHIDDMLNDDSKEARREGRKERRKARHRATSALGKAKKKADKQKTADKKAADRDWEMGGKNAMTSWLHGNNGSSSSSNTSSSNSGSKSTSSDFDDPRLWEVTKWVKKLISKRGNRKENPDRDKSDNN